MFNKIWSFKDGSNLQLSEKEKGCFILDYTTLNGRDGFTKRYARYGMASRIAKEFAKEKDANLKSF